MADLSKPVESMRATAEEWRFIARKLMDDANHLKTRALEIHDRADALDKLARDVEKWCPDKEDDE